MGHGVVTGWSRPGRGRVAGHDSESAQSGGPWVGAVGPARLTRRCDMLAVEPAMSMLGRAGAANRE